MKPQLVVCLLWMGLMALCFSACHPTNEVTPNLPPSSFNVTAKLVAGTTDVILTWSRAKDSDGDPITYTVVYNDTLAKNLTDTSYTISKTGYDTTVAGRVIAKDSRGATTSSIFRVTTSSRPNLPPEVFQVSARLAANKPDVVLTWTKAKDADPVAYIVIYKDTLVKNLIDSTFTIINVGYNTTITGSVIAKDSQGATTIVTFSILTTPIVAGQRFRIKRTVSGSQYYTPTTYTYDQNGRLSTFYEAYGRNYQSISGRRTTNLAYDEQGHLLSAEGRDDGGGGYLDYRYEYGYNEQGTLISEKYYSTTTVGSHTLVLKSESQFEYGPDKLPVKKITVSSVNPVTTKYTYSNGNLVRIDQSDEVGTAYDPIIYQYDTNPNPFLGLTTASLLGDAALAYSKNNVIVTSYKSYSIYTYNSNGLLVKIASPDGGYTKTYEYEAY